MFKGSTVVVVPRSPLDEYHSTLTSDAVAQRRLAALHERCAAHSSSLLPSVPPQVTPTWLSLEERVESDVTFFRALLGLSSVWSPTLCDRLRARCAAHGPQSFISSRGLAPSDAQSTYLGGGLVMGKALSASLGTTSQDASCAYAWVYRFVDPAVATAHLLSHPLFGVGVSPLSQSDDDNRACSTARVALVTTSPPGDVRQRSDAVSGKRSTRFQSVRFVVLMVTWQGTSRKEPPLGADLAEFLDAQRTRGVVSNTQNLDVEARIEEDLRFHLAKLQVAVDNIGLGRMGELDAASRLQAQLNEVLTNIADVWALRDAVKEDVHRPPRESGRQMPAETKERGNAAGRLTVLEEQVKSLIQRGLISGLPQEPASGGANRGLTGGMPQEPVADSFPINRPPCSPPHVICRLEDLSPASDSRSSN